MNDNMTTFTYWRNAWRRIGSPSIFVLILIQSFVTQAISQTDQSNIQFTQGQVNESANLSLSIPLANYKGRGVDLPINLNYSSSAWNIEHVNSVYNYSTYGVGIKQSIAQAIFAEHSRAGWKTSLDLPKIEFPKHTEVFDYRGRGTIPGNGNGCYGYRIRRVVIHLPDGSTHELRENDVPYQDAYSIDKDGTFYAVDGSRIRFDSTHSSAGEGTGTIFLPDGTRYILGHPTSSIVDKNGNTVTFDETTGLWTDTVGRQVYNPIPANPQAQDYTYNLPGLANVNNGLLTYTLKWRYLANTLTPDANGQTPALKVMAKHYLPSPGAPPTASNGGNFPQQQSSQYQALFMAAEPTYESGSEPTHPVPTLVVGQGQTAGQSFNPVVLSEIVLPDGKSYKFTYNVYGEIDKVVYPTNAYDRYTHDLTVTEAEGYSEPYTQAKRNIVSRKMSLKGDGSDILEWQYIEAGNSYAFGNPIGDGMLFKKISIIAPDKTRTEVLKYEPFPMQNTALGFTDARIGMVVQRNTYSTSTTGLAGDLLRREITQYEHTPNNYTWNPGCNGTGHPVYVKASRNPRPVKTVNLLFEGSGPALAQTTTFAYGSGDGTTTGLDQTLVNAYHYASVSNATAQTGTIDQISQGALAKSTSTTFLQDPAYTSANILGMKATVEVTVSNTLVSRSEMIYDEQAYSAGEVRGLPTTQRTWDSNKGLVGDPAAYIQTHSGFDGFGNQIESYDAKGYKTVTVYDGAHNVYPVSITTPIPDENGGANSSAASFTSLTNYDPITGVVLSTTDANGKTTHMEYNDPLLRVSKVIAPSGHQTITEYGAGNSENTRYVKVRSQIDNSDRWTEALNWYDGAGRTYRTEKANSEGNIYSDIEFTNMGRVARTSDSYRAGDVKRWLTPIYDDLGRTTKMTSPDQSATPTTVQFGYGLSTSGILGTTKLITDQAGRKRMGITNALGQMVRVIEDPNGQNLATDYEFDGQNNLVKTTQGEQNRYFRYDSLGRLLFAKHPEQNANPFISGSNFTDPITGNNQWSARFQYDNNSNMTSVTDARNITVNATYDRLNRIILRNYSDSTPDVTFYYDGKGLQQAPANSLGKTTRVANSVSENQYTAFDEMGKLLASKQITDNETYDFQYTYDLSGTMIEKRLPSGRIIRTDVDEDGELSRVQSRKDENSGYWTYADSFAYDNSGAVTKMQLGNGRWQTAQYNVRGQITEIGLGATPTTPNLLKLEFAYTSTPTSNDNNGSVRQQKMTVPTIGGVTGFTATQNYTYDALNRLTSAAETVTGQTWKQTFTFDRYGNRRFDPNNTTTLGSCHQYICNPSVSTANNRFLNSEGYFFDSAGNMTSDPQANLYLYDGENRQQEFKNDEGVTLGRYQYDGEGRRVRKISSTEDTVFVYDGGGQLAAEFSTQTPETPQVSYLTEDHLGSPRVITNQSGTVTSRKDFAAFGDEIVTPERTVARGYDEREIRRDYTGYLKDIESGLEYAGARYYNPGHGRFTSVDPFTASAAIKNPQTFNRYSYVLNSPYKFTDPLGLFPAGGGGCGRNRCVPVNSSDSGFLGATAGTADDQVQSGQAAVAAPTPPTPAASPTPPTKPGTTNDGQVQTTPQPVAPAENGVMVEGSASKIYNCLAFALGIKDLWIDQNIRLRVAGDWSSAINLGGIKVVKDKEGSNQTVTILPKLPDGVPENNRGKVSMKGVVKHFGGKETTKDKVLEQGQYRVVVFEDESKPRHTHVMKQEPDGTWSSKNGPDELFKGIKDPVAFYNTHYNSKNESRPGVKATYFAMKDKVYRKEVF